MSGAPDALLHQWQSTWPQALALWSRYTRLHSPLWCQSSRVAASAGLTQSFAMIRLHDQSVVVDLEAIARFGLQDYGLEILAHEIGHHILAPATLSDHARLIARMRHNLPGCEARAPLVANLYTDLLINHRLQHQHGLRMADIYQCLNRTTAPGGRVWPLYLRICEMLWQRERQSLGGVTDSAAMEGDAWLGARIIKVYAQDWLTGGSRFAALLLPYLLHEEALAESVLALADTREAGGGQIPPGLISKDEGEDEDVHPAHDPALTGTAPAATAPGANGTTSAPGRGAGQFREPFEYGEILRAAGLKLSDQEIAIRYYRERAIPWLVSFPGREQPAAQELIPEGTRHWEPGEPLEAIDWFGTLAISPVVIPGFTTVQRQWGEASGPQPQWLPCNLDLYVDCSGSMPNPQRELSYTALAGAILSLSALRAGAQVQVTLWSGTQQFITTPGFVSDESRILAVLTGYFGGGTAFPIHRLRQTYLESSVRRDTHVVILSDEGVTTLFDADEQGNSGWDIAGRALERARGGGTLVLNLPWDYPRATPPSWHQTPDAQLKQAAREQGWAIYAVSDWEAMVRFAQDFSRQHYRPPTP